MTPLRTVRRSLVLAALAIALIVPVARAQESDLVVTKSGPAQAAAGTDVSYSVTVLNAGPDASAAITLTDPIPSGMTFVSASPSGCSTPAVGANGTIVCVIPGLAAGVSAIFTFVFHIDPGAPPGTFFTNIATTSSATDSTDENNSGVAVTSTPPPPQADVGITKSAPGATGPDTDLAFTIAVQNGGPDAATGVTWTDTLPGNLTFVSLAPDGGCTTPAVGAGGTVSCTIASLAAGSAITYTLTVHVPTGTPSGVTYSNETTVSALSADPNDENNESGALVTVSTVDVSVVKQGPPVANAGDVVAYALALANVGPDAAVNVNLSDVLPPDTTFVSFSHDAGQPPTSCSQPAVGETGTVTCTYETLAPTGMPPVFFTLQVRAGNTTSVSNTLTVTTGSFDTNQSNNSSMQTTSVTPRADLAITKTGPPTVTAGADATYTLTATNLGVSDAASVSITDTVAAPFTFVSLSQTTGPTFSCTMPALGAIGTITCNRASLAVSATATFTLVLRAAAAAPAGGSAANTATITATTADPAPDNNQSTATTTIVTSAEVGVGKTGPATAVAGANVSYSITVTNAGPSDAATVSLSDTVPANTTFVSANQTTGPAFSCLTPAVGGTGTITCTIATLPAGASATFAIVLQVAPNQTGSVVNTTTVSTTTPDPNSGNDASTTTATAASSADVRVAKSGPPSTPAGTNVTYTVTVANAGPSDAGNVSLTDTLPAGTTFVSASQTTGPTFSCLTPAVGGTGTIACTIATLPAGASATFAIVLAVTPDATGSITNTASVVTATVDPTPANNSAGASTAVVGADVGIVKTAGPVLGGRVLYTIVVTNHGPATALDVVVTDALPAGTTLDSASPTQGSCAGTSTVVCTLGTLTAGASSTITLAVVLPASTASVANTATVTGTSTDPNPANNTSTAEVVPVATIPALSPLTFVLLGITLAAVGYLVLRRRSAATRC
jgi:uncharacterized repeat protein (TIGR01451 family)